MPVDVLVFIDDGRLIDPSMSGLIRITDACVTTRRSKGGMVHPRKLLFYHFPLVDIDIQAVPTPVPANQTAASLEPPLVACWQGYPSFTKSQWLVCLPNCSGA